MAWCRTGHKPLPKPMMTKFYDTIYYAQWTQVNSLRLCDLYASIDCVSIGSCNGLSPFRYQTITRTKDDLSSIGPLYPLYTGAAPFVSPLCDHKTDQVAVEGTEEAERLPWSFKGGTEDVQTSPWTPWSQWSFEHVRNSRTKVAEEVGRWQIAQRRQKEGTRIAVVAEWMHRGQPLVVVNIVC